MKRKKVAKLWTDTFSTKFQEAAILVVLTWSLEHETNQAIGQYFYASEAYAFYKNVRDVIEIPTKKKKKWQRCGILFLFNDGKGQVFVVLK